jgi:hypothetical protein
MKIFIDDDILREMRAVTQERLFTASATSDATLAFAKGRLKRAPVDRSDTAQNGIRLVTDIATIYSNYRIKTELLERQGSPRRKRARAP